MTSTYKIDTEKAARILNERIAEISTLEKTLESGRYSDGSELIPAEVQASQRRNGDRLVNATLVSGYTVTDGGLLNNYAIEPQLYVEETARSGFTPFAEKLNGRYAMIGFASLLVIEVLTKHGLIWWLNNL
ncbi:hypothetical protein TUMEXPCC7403_20280 [Tumidithrix helvetica PCC 7403]